MNQKKFISIAVFFIEIYPDFFIENTEFCSTKYCKGSLASLGRSPYIAKPLGCTFSIDDKIKHLDQVIIFSNFSSLVHDDAAMLSDENLGIESLNLVYLHYQ